MASSGMCLRLSRGLYNISSLSLYRQSLQRCNRWQPLSTAADSNATESKTENSETAAEHISEVEKTLKEEKEKLTKQIEELQDKYKRSLAETENVRRRMKKQIDDAKLFGIQGFCKDLLEVADILNKATDSVPKDQLNGSNAPLVNLHQGLNMTETQLQKVFQRHGLYKIDPVEGDKFNPNIHEALFQAPLSDGKTPGSIAIIEKIGYKLHERTLRPALVGVFKDA